MRCDEVGARRREPVRGPEGRREAAGPGPLRWVAWPRALRFDGRISTRSALCGHRHWHPRTFARSVAHSSVATHHRYELEAFVMICYVNAEVDITACFKHRLRTPAQGAHKESAPR